MKESSPWYDVFFQAKGKLTVKNIKESLDKLAKDYFPSEKLNISVKYDQVSHTLDSLDDLETFFDKENLIETVSCNTSKKNHSFHIIIQFNNPISGTNGNFRVMFGTKEINKKVENYLFDTLNLKVMDFGNKILTENEMKINPVFRGRNFSIKTKTVFILMPFTLSWSDRVWNHLNKICLNNGFTAFRANNLYGHDVLEDIWESINSADYIIADMSSKNPNVMYEIGISHTLGKKTILISQDQEDIPFDFRRYRILLYEDNVDGFKILENEIPEYLKTN